MSAIVYDTSCILAVARREAGAEVILAGRQGAILSPLSQAEAVAELLKAGVSRQDIEEFLRDVFPLSPGFDRAQAALTGEWMRKLDGQSLSMGDCASLALAEFLGAPLLTGNQAWRGVQAEIEIRWFR